MITGGEGQEFSLTPEMLKIERKTFKQSGEWQLGRFISGFIDYLSVREFVPNVIEPSFGIGRILYVLLEHSYWARKEDVDRGVSRLRTSRPNRFSFKFGVILGSVPAALGCSDKGFDCPAQRERGV